MQDVGFDYQGEGGKDNFIIDVYFHHHFPKAVSVMCPSACYRLQHSGCVRQQVSRPGDTALVSHPWRGMLHLDPCMSSQSYDFLAQDVYGIADTATLFMNVT